MVKVPLFLDVTGTTETNLTVRVKNTKSQVKTDFFLFEKKGVSFLKSLLIINFIILLYKILNVYILIKQRLTIF